jgi:hypothetical protein
MRRILALTIVAVSFARVSKASAQGDDSGVGYVSLVTTPSAGVSPLVRQWMLSDPRSKTSFDAQWGHFSGIGADFNMFTGGVTFPVKSGKADFGLSAGYDKLSCAGCGGFFVAGAVYEGSLKQSAGTGSTFTLGLSGRLGYARSNFSDGAASFWSASVGLPLSFAFGQGDATRIVPFLTPAFGAGHVGAGLDETGVRFLVGGGIGIVNQPAGIGVTVGAQRVIISGGKIVFGLGLSLIPR